MKRSTLVVLSTALFILTGCVGAEHAPEPAHAPATVSAGAITELTNAGLEYFDRNLPNRAAHAAAWRLQDHKS